MIDSVKATGAIALKIDGPSSVDGGGGEGFLSVLSSLGRSAASSLTEAERTSVRAITGDASAREVVDSLMQAEQSLQTVLAVRDKTVAAIQDITKMAI